MQSPAVSRRSWVCYGNRKLSSHVAAADSLASLAESMRPDLGSHLFLRASAAQVAGREGRDGSSSFPSQHQPEMAAARSLPYTSRVGGQVLRPRVLPGRRRAGTAGRRTRRAASWRARARSASYASTTPTHPPRSVGGAGGGVTETCGGSGERSGGGAGEHVVHVPRVGSLLRPRLLRVAVRASTAAPNTHTTNAGHGHSLAGRTRQDKKGLKEAPSNRWGAGADKCGCLLSAARGDEG
jgi:hypothetical protein